MEMLDIPKLEAARLVRQHKKWELNKAYVAIVQELENAEGNR